MTLTFIVREPVSINRAYGRRKASAAGGFDGERGLFLRKEAARFKRAVQAAALVARSQSDWPRDPLLVAKARVSYQLYDYRGDVDGPRKIIRDALERVLFDNDRCVEDGLCPLPIADGNGKRVEIVVTLLETRTKAEADKIRERRQKALERRLRRGAA